ncbi:hypothetical protein CRE_07962 [Caenorhabditis remanei]|uniref:BTB domain-containing protein n=1 Tax=Caenorhabditis remanei TaxID=31234 RepID=E3NUA3_CAERE|nr:hypothetical protein CRE_07962 [Caenorhabditis remanei]
MCGLNVVTSSETRRDTSKTFKKNNIILSARPHYIFNSKNTNKNRTSFYVNSNSTSGIHTFKNVVAHLAQREHQTYSFVTIGGYVWKLVLGVFDEMYFRPYLICGNGNPKVEVLIRYYLKVRNSNEILQEKFKQEAFTNLERDKIAIGKPIPLLEVLNLKNGWLKDEKCTVEYGIQIEAVQGDDGNRKFNFYGKLFDCKQKQNMIRFCQEIYSNNKRYLHCHKQILSHNCPHYSDNTTESHAKLIPDHDIEFSDLEKCLQIAHGVRMKSSTYLLFEMIKIAQSLYLTNASHFIEEQLIWKKYKDEVFIQYAIKCDLSRFLAVHLKKVTPEQALNIIRSTFNEGQIDNSSMEIKKMIVAKVLYRKY